jgi:predicted ArsR family transcriptional regulator
MLLGAVDIPPTTDDDLLALPIRARLLRLLGELRRPAPTQELARGVGRHPNSTRTQLQALADAGLVERRTTRQVRGRPRDEWVIAPGVAPAGQPAQAYGQLSVWLARALATRGGLAAIEREGREIGRELAPEPADRGAAAAMKDALSALGFAPRPEVPSPGRLRLTLHNCPYREAVRENQPAVCRLHRGITAGLLDRIDPGARVTAFIPQDPYAAGCVIDLEAVTAAG